ncbi:hypothetical protein, partial [Bacillus pseudomycoides]|uniref:hypothetical protein n=1 Tax=Bacillus pseudomycoides TaxID=64104 RepID=UPI00196AA71E
VFSSRLTPYQPLVRGKVKLSFANVLPVKGYLLPITIIQVTYYSYRVSSSLAISTERSNNYILGGLLHENQLKDSKHYIYFDWFRYLLFWHRKY